MFLNGLIPLCPVIHTKHSWINATKETEKYWPKQAFGINCCSGIFCFRSKHQGVLYSSIIIQSIWLSLTIQQSINQSTNHPINQAISQTFLAIVLKYCTWCCSMGLKHVGVHAVHGTGTPPPPHLFVVHSTENYTASVHCANTHSWFLFLSIVLKSICASRLTV